ncbi:ABC transporter substrate-binding protein [Okibacterium endophyticum]
MKSTTGAGATALALATAALLTLSACSTKASSQTGDTSGDVITGSGISDGTINLGMLTDLSGNFAAVGKEMAQTAELYWQQKNAEGGVCGEYPVELNIKDNAYNVQNTVSLFSEMKSDVLAFQNILGTAPALAVLPDLVDSEMLAILRGQGQEALGHSNLLMTGITYELEAMNGLSYLREQGLLDDGATIASVYLQGSFGENVLVGVQDYAAIHDVTVEETQVTAQTTDLSPAIADLKSKDVSAIVFSGTPPQLASLATAAEAAGLDVPILTGAPVWTSGLLDTPAAAALVEHLYLTLPVTSFDSEAASAFREGYVAEHPDEDPSITTAIQYSEALTLDAVLEQACADGDLTPAGVLAARSKVTSVDTGGLTPTLDLSDPAKPSTPESFIARVNVEFPGGLETVDGPYVSDDVLALVENE